ncbi:MFS transporter [Leifsonia sp. F6_8S_P_1B]|uniref:MFS transporter n=1 Tax=Leifsonia williamsii TaxID=3035919 RepID=A0ABT8KE01_9MICO|nr:MFS transporter [Leifsonia williamsii]MDN4615690.1 MFS transporter [Leifsonia williamsii]
MSSPARPVRRPRRGIGHAAGFWTVAAAFLTVMAFATLPTPLYALYQRRDGFPTWVITVIFAAFAVGVLGSLYLIGHLSDVEGRRRMVLLALLLELASAVVFIVWPEVPGLVVARVVSGIGVGALTASATAHLAELRAVTHPEEGSRFPAMVATVVSTGGLALGPLIGGVFAQLLPAPLLLPYLVFAILLAVAAVAVSRVPETVHRPEPRPRYRPQRVSVPPAARAGFTAAAVAAFAAFSVFGLYTSLAPSVLAGTLREPSHLVAGAVSFSVFAASTASQLLLVRVGDRAQLVVALVLVLVGLLALGAGVLLSSLAVFVASALLTGGGVGLLFRSAIAAAAALAEPHRRGEVLATIFLVGYLGLALPVLVVGAALLVWPLVPVLVVFAAAVAALTLVGGMRMLRIER